MAEIKQLLKNNLIRIIINADDYGMSKNFNEGIIYCARKKLITSTTVLVNRLYVNTLICKYKLSIGLHLEFDYTNNSKVFGEIISKQYRKFLKIFERKPSHIDVHKQYSSNPKIFKQILELAKKEKLPIRSDKSFLNKKIEKANLRTTDKEVIWITYKKTMEIMKNLKNLKSGTYELMCHPGYYDPKSSSSLNKKRENDIKFLKSKIFQGWINKNNIKLINYNQL